MQRVHLVIRGRVQSVGFRHFILRQASALRLAGWVRNRADGAVEVEAHGPVGALASLLEAAKRGPIGARVTSVDDSWGDSDTRPSGFHVVG